MYGLQQIKIAAHDFNVSERWAIAKRIDYLKAQMLLKDAEIRALPENADDDELIETAHELLQLKRQIHWLRNPGTNAITTEMIESARKADIRILIEFDRQHKAEAPCHDDRRPSLVFLSRTCKAWCPVCDKKWNALDWLIEIEGASFPDAVRQLAL